MKSKLLAAGGLLSVSLAAGLQADTLLNIDDTNPAAVTITATSSFSSTDTSSILLVDGIELGAFFTANVALPGSGISGNLTPVSPGIAYTLASSDSLGGGNSYGDGTGLNIYHAFALGGNNPQNFSTSAQAFTGSATLDLSALGHLPGLGTSGTLYAGFSGDANVAIGTWHVTAGTPVPEPSTMACAAGAVLGGFALLRRRKKA